MADKDFQVRQFLKDEFPQANVLLCIFHALRFFSREISCEKLGLASQQQEICLQVLWSMVWARDDQEYNLLVKFEVAPKPVLVYFNANQRKILNERSLGSKFFRSNFPNTTNRLESLNTKLKSVIKRFSSLEEFTDGLFSVLMSLNSKSDHKAAQALHKQPVIVYQDKKEKSFSDYFPPFAFSYVKKKLVQSTNVLLPADSPGLYRLDSSCRQIEVTMNSCTCSTRTTLLLPCRHIFAARELEGIYLFHLDLCHRKWSKKHFYSNQMLH